jgi:hypothetical protein
MPAAPYLIEAEADTVYGFLSRSQAEHGISRSPHGVVDAEASEDYR